MAWSGDSWNCIGKIILGVILRRSNEIEFDQCAMYPDTFQAILYPDTFQVIQ